MEQYTTFTGGKAQPWTAVSLLCSFEAVPGETPEGLDLGVFPTELKFTWKAHQ